MKRVPTVEIILVILGTLLYFGANIQRVAVPGAIFDVLQQDLNTTAQAITSLGTAFMYVYALSQLVIGIFVARFGGFRVITAGSVLFFAGGILFSISNNLPLLYLSRVLIGFGSATFYLGMIDETKRIVPSKNFGIALSMILLIGYLGGIVANAPLVLCIHKLGWRETFLITAIAAGIIALIFFVLNYVIKHRPVDKSVHLNLELFKEVLSNRKNRILYLTTSLNYGLFYVLQAISGKKFLEDFCQITVMQAAIILSLMGAFYALSGPVSAFISKAILYRKTIFLKITSFNFVWVFAFILVCLALNIKTPIICALFCLISIGSNLSPLVVPLLHDYNTQRASNTAVSIMTCGFYLTVGILGSISGFLLDYFTPFTSNGAMIYSNKSYIAIFLVMFVLALISFINVFRIEESKKTLHLIRHVQYLKERSDVNMPENYGNYTE